ncbi:Fur family transcriptional regulator [Neptuniibacter caesariensis]|uniref:Ferric uptake regulation protein n=1 Tax=Neptuniibacter caesariensis TaxID=207954 RepID=A0A7U8CA23_NEPCE|nr:Fur family transcriptional regulator [Neptuniibacter caesariensis]EAR62616.1 transcriptional regulator, Fur family protein [Oceanospirillum sp. MED92] [Neptuniibacter caesariensis]
MANQNLGFHSDHDHTGCIEQALEGARALCSERNLRFTPIRELVLKTIWQSHKPLGAYELLPALAEAGFNSAPPTVYRALDFLQEQGLVHRIALLNAFIGCPHPNEQHQGSFLICKACNNAVEIDTDEVGQVINSQASKLGFIPEKQSIEVLGTCPECVPDKLS